MGYQRQSLGRQDSLGADDRPVTPMTGGRLSICESGLRTALAPVRAGGRAERWLVAEDGHRLWQLRHEHRLFQQVLADWAGISVGTIGLLKRQARARCRGRTLARLAAALGAPPSALLPSAHKDRTPFSPTR
jgi:DNA-binding Xre family transcriptional regulator